MEEETETYNRGLQVLYVKCREDKNLEILHVGNNLHIPFIFIEEQTPFHKVKCRFMKCNIDLRTNVDIKSINSNIFRIYHILTVGSYSITNKTDKG